MDARRMQQEVLAVSPSDAPAAADVATNAPRLSATHQAQEEDRAAPFLNPAPYCPLAASLAPTLPSSCNN